MPFYKKDKASFEAKFKRTKIPQYISILGVIWTLLIFLSASWNIYEKKQTTKKLMTNEALSHFNKDQAFRFWATTHGGVYVPETERTPANPNLKHIPQRDIITDTGTKLTLMNPAYMLRQMMDEYAEFYGIKGRITSLKPLRPQNAPDEWEKEALIALGNGAKEVFEYVDINGNPHLRLIRPMVTKKGCLKCHAHQGYKIGDIRGGVGVSVPISPYLDRESSEIKKLIISHFLIWFMGAFFLILGFKSLKGWYYKQQEAEKSLQQSEQHQRQIIENSGAGYFSLDRDGCFQFVNSAWLKMHKYETLDEVIGKHFSITQRDSDIEKAQDIVESLMEGDGSTITGEFTRKCKDDSIGYHTYSVIPVKNKESIIGIEGFIIDTTEYKLLEEHLRQSHKMQSIGTMAGGIAHDFNNILYMIIGNAELALEDIPENNPAQGSLEEIKSASLKGAEIVKQILNFSRPDAQKRKPINVVKVIRDSLKFLRATIPSYIELRQSIVKKNVSILADPTQIGQIMMNLCNNACYAMGQTGGVLEVDVKDVHLTEDSIINGSIIKAGKYIKIEVGDTGPGIDSEIMDRIFDPYFTTKEIGDGSGMGLTVVHGMIKNHDGVITVQNKPDTGTTFKIYFPIIEELTEPENLPTEELPNGIESILFVDDEKSIASTIRMTLERLGYSVETRLNPEKALELFKSKPDDFDLVITDMTMPYMTGDQLAKKILSLKPDTPIIICTGFSEKINEEQAENLGVKGFLMKPVTKSDMALMVRKVLDETKNF